MKLTCLSKDQKQQLYYEVQFDFDKLNDMAVKASRNKSGKSRDGAVTVVIKKREDIKEKP